MAKPFKDGVDQGRRVVPSRNDQHHSGLGLWNQPYLYFSSTNQIKGAWLLFPVIAQETTPLCKVIW